MKNFYSYSIIFLGLLFFIIIIESCNNQQSESSAPVAINVHLHKHKTAGHLFRLKTNEVALIDTIYDGKNTSNKNDDVMFIYYYIWLANSWNFNNQMYYNGLGYGSWEEQSKPIQKNDIFSTYYISSDGGSSGSSIQMDQSGKPTGKVLTEEEEEELENENEQVDQESVQTELAEAQAEAQAEASQSNEANPSTESAPAVDATPPAPASEPAPAESDDGSDGGSDGGGGDGGGD